MRGMKIGAGLLIGLVMLSAVKAARSGEWEDYMNSPYQDFRWDWLVRDGHLAYQQGKYTEALNVYQQAEKKGCKDPLMLFRMGYSYRALRKNKEAGAYLAASMKTLAEAYPKHRYNWFGRYYLAEMLFQAGEAERAKKELELAVKRNPDFYQALLLFGNIHYQEGRHDLAAEKYLRASEVNSKSTEAFVNLAACYDAAGKYEKALDACLKAKALSPDDVKISLALAGAYSRLKQSENALKEYERVLGLQLDSRAGQAEKALIGAGNAAWESGNSEKAVEYYQKAIALDLSSYEALLGVGLAMMKMEQPDKAEEYLRRSLEVKPESKEAHYNLGVLHDSRGDFEHAIKEYTRAIEIDPDDESCWYSIGLAFIKAGSYEQAKDWLNKAIEKFGKDSKWGKADLKLLELIERIEKGKEAEVDKELEKALKGEESPRGR